MKHFDLEVALSNVVDQVKANRNALARALWRVENRLTESDDAVESRQSYLDVRSKYLQTAVQIINKLEREGIALIAAGETQGEER